jgi:hypothetical protein
MLAVGGEVGLVLPYFLPEYEYDSDCDAGNTFGDQHSVYGVAFAPGETDGPVLATAHRTQ